MDERLRWTSWTKVMRYFLIDFKHIITVYAINEKYLWSLYILPLYHIRQSLSIKWVEVVWKAFTLSLGQLPVLLDFLNLSRYNALKTLLFPPLLFLLPFLGIFLQLHSQLSFSLEYFPKSVFFVLLFSYLFDPGLTLFPFLDCTLSFLHFLWFCSLLGLVVCQSWVDLWLDNLNLHDFIQPIKFIFWFIFPILIPASDGAHTITQNGFFSAIVSFFLIESWLNFQPHYFVVSWFFIVCWNETCIAVLLFLQTGATWSDWTVEIVLALAFAEWKISFKIRGAFGCRWGVW